MGTHKTDPHHTIRIIHLHDQPVMVAFDVEHHSVVRQKRSAGIIPLDVVGPFPGGIFRFLILGLKLLLTAGMLLPEIPQCLFGDYSQIVFSAKIKEVPRMGNN